MKLLVILFIIIRYAKDAKIQEVFQTVGDRQKRNWAKGAVLSRDSITPQIQAYQQQQKKQQAWYANEWMNYDSTDLV